MSHNYKELMMNIYDSHNSELNKEVVESIKQIGDIVNKYEATGFEIANAFAELIAMLLLTQAKGIFDTGASKIDAEMFSMATVETAQIFYEHNLGPAADDKIN